PAPAPPAATEPPWVPAPRSWALPCAAFVGTLEPPSSGGLNADSPAPDHRYRRPARHRDRRGFCGAISRCHVRRRTSGVVLVGVRHPGGTLVPLGALPAGHSRHSRPLAGL